MGLNWKGKQVSAEVEKSLIPALVEIGLRTEGEGKKELYKGHGVLTGTLRRSIHAAEPEYNFGGDNVEPGPGTPELGGREATPQNVNGRLMIAVGSGLVYALPAHQGHGGFGGYHFMTNAVEKVQPMVGDIVKRYRK